MAKMVYNRKNYIIDKQLQFKFIATFLILIIVSLMLFSTGFAVFYYMKYKMGDKVYSEFILIQEQGTSIDADGNEITISDDPYYVNRFELIVPPILFNNLIMLIVVSIIGIFYSHKIAGPAYRIQEDIKRVLGGEKDVVIRLRKKDKLKELADKVNKLIEEYSKK